ncbi:MAG TPA: maleylpyruvate isomerase family mycothiol-dependent enzyme [Pseudonocardia sp.]|nr:maleylpyruvate isomerase family mycothiol-dependent enzyme [Pseudonocardia sp.]
MTRTLATSLAWAGDGAAHLRGLMSRMADAAFAAPSLLPGWSRAHVLTHLARNADAMINLLDWARTGTPTPAYASREQRDRDIDDGATRPPQVIRDDVIGSSDRLAAAVRAMPQAAWAAEIGAPRGGGVMPASDVPWLRAREMWVHAVDLDVGASLADAPGPMLVELLDEVTATMGTSGQSPPMELVATDLRRSWPVGAAAAVPGAAGDVRRVEVRGSAADLATWLLGRSRGREVRTVDGSPVPIPPRWL